MGDWTKARLAAAMAGERAVIPTADFYVLTPLGASPGRAPLIRRAGPFSFTAGDDAVILVRHMTRADRRAVERAAPGRFFYVVDDLLRGPALRGSGLPADYAARLEAAAGRLDWILRRDPVIVAPNRTVADQFGPRRTLVVPPSLLMACEAFDHFDSLSGRPRIACLGTRSHVGDLEAIAPALEALSRRHPRLEIATFLGRHLPDRLKALGTVRNRRPLPWPLFKRVLKAERFHVALAPLRDTPFNGARSPTKLLDHAAVGAAGIYSARAPYADIVSPGVDGLLAGDDPREWLTALEGLIADPAGARRLAENGVALARRIGDPRRARALWEEALGSPLRHARG